MRIDITGINDDVRTGFVFDNFPHYIRAEVHKCI